MIANICKGMELHNFVVGTTSCLFSSMETLRKVQFNWGSYMGMITCYAEARSGGG